MYESMRTKIIFGDGSNIRIDDLSAVLLKTPPVDINGFVESIDSCRELMISFLHSAEKQLMAANTFIRRRNTIRYVKLELQDLELRPYTKFACCWLENYFQSTPCISGSISNDKKTVYMTVDIYSTNMRFIGIILSTFLYLSRYILDKNYSLAKGSTEVIKEILTSHNSNNISFYTAWFYWLIQEEYFNYSSDVHWENGPAQLGQKLITAYPKQFLFFLKDFASTWQTLNLAIARDTLAYFFIKEYRMLLQNPTFMHTEV